MLIKTIKLIICILFYIGNCLSILNNKKHLVSKFPLEVNKHINPYSTDINRLNLVFDTNIADISRGKYIIIVNDNKLSRLIQRHLNIAGVSNRIHRHAPISSIVEFILDSINFFKRSYINSNVDVVIGCNFNIFQFFWWRLRCLLGGLKLIIASSHSSRCSVGIYSVSDGWRYHDWFGLMCQLFSGRDGSVLSTELAGGIAACESLKSMMSSVGHGAEKWIYKIKTPDAKSVDILLVGAGAVGTEMIRMLNEIGLLNSKSTITIVDFDTVDTVNLNTQLIYKQEDVGKTKVDAINNYLNKTGKEQHGQKLGVTAIYEKFNGPAGKKIFKDWLKRAKDNNIKLIIGAVDNFKTRMLIDRYSLLYRIPFLEVGIEGTKASSSITVPYITESYSSMPGNDLVTTASCTVKGIPNNTTDTALFAKIVTNSVLFKGDNYNQTKSQIKKTVTSIFPKNDESWFNKDVDNIINLSLKVQEQYKEERGKVY